MIRKGGASALREVESKLKYSANREAPCEIPGEKGRSRHGERDDESPPPPPGVPRQESVPDAYIGQKRPQDRGRDGSHCGQRCGAPNEAQ